MDDETPRDDLAVLKNPSRPPPATPNRFLVGVLEDTIVVTAVTPRRFSRDEALNLAAWLIAKADEPVAFDHFLIAGAVVSVEFAELLQSVQGQ